MSGDMWLQPSHDGGGYREAVEQRMKAIVLAAGRATRMRRSDGAAALTRDQEQAAEAGLKVLMPFGRPFLDYVLSQLVAAGCGEIGLVVRSGDAALTQYCRSLPSDRFRVTLLHQSEPKGTAHAVATAESFVGGEPFLVVNGDNFYPLRALRRLVELGRAGVVGFRASALAAKSNIAADRLAQFSLLVPGPDDQLVEIIEKPNRQQLEAAGDLRLIGMNCWCFDDRIFSACGRIKPSSRGELELPDAVMDTIRNDGVTYRVLVSEDPVWDLSYRADVAAVERRLRSVEVGW